MKIFNLKSKLGNKIKFQNFLKYITNEESVFTFKTNLNAPKYKLVRVDLNDANLEWKDLIAEKEDVLESVKCVNHDRLLLNYMHHCKVIDIKDFDISIFEVKIHV